MLQQSSLTIFLGLEYFSIVFISTASCSQILAAESSLPLENLVDNVLIYGFYILVLIDASKTPNTM